MAGATMRRIEELEGRRARLEARLAELQRRERAVKQAAAARQASADRKADTRRKCVLAGALLALLRGNPQLLDYLRRALPPVAAERDRPLLTALLDSVSGAPPSS